MKANNMGTLTGRLARDPEERGGGTVVTFTLAVDGWNGKEKQKETDFIRCTAFGGLGETIMKHCQKGRQITIGFHLKPRSWEDPSGGKRTELSVIADDMTFGAPAANSGGGGGYSGPADEWNTNPTGPDDFSLV